MPNTIFQSFTIGKDMSLVLEMKNILGSIAPKNTGNVLLDVSDLGYLENWNSKPLHSTIEIKPISHGGQKRFRDKFEHWEGGFNLARVGLATDLLIQVLQDSLLASGGGAVLCDILHTVYDPMGNPTGNGVFLYGDCTLTPDDAGTYTSDQAVMQGFTFKCPRRYLLDANQAPDANSAATKLLALASVLPTKPA